MEKQAGTMLEEMQQTNEALVRDTAASLARAEAGSLQRIKAKDSEIHALQQLVLQTKQDAAEKIKAAIEECVGAPSPATSPQRLVRKRATPCRRSRAGETRRWARGLG